MAATAPAIGSCGAGVRLARRLPASGTVSPRWPSAMDFQPPYFPPPFPGAQGPNPTGDVFSQHLATDPYQQYAVSSPEQMPQAFEGSHSCSSKNHILAKQILTKENT